MKDLRAFSSLCLIVGSFLSLINTSCDRNYVFQKMEKIEGKTWNARDTVTIDFKVTDTSSPHNFYLKVRNNTDYPYRNLYFFLDMEFPNGKHWLDTVECRLADGKGNWTGSGIGNIMDHSFLFIHRKRFPITGKHRFHIVHAMRKKKLRGIVDVGLAVEKSPQKER
ncbi:MAG: gliding motility lipoprotein GldH [Flavobacteriales bacterium]